MKRVLAGSLLLAGALATNLYGRDEIVWDQSSLKDVRCADSLPNLKFQSRSSFSLENTILFLWAAHVMENNSSDEVQSQFQDLGFSDIEMITPDSVGGCGIYDCC
ncbi:hypothetical protein [Pseudobacteriovorax antillogorgiicola]|uniref:Uncharacterized protein n=1 Tax=Pseudobacteriovorax antillogorgiicola TaxID=1513793 RepID=A0A1Y6CMK8_9BACT|nr:hypothetical protein [Pseudobacteriovorax antillogorgiicola]TCS44575.1 hypothetical protein EDD56_1328 [Pseudobacteriovorax antillogorgiicola]SMF77982.1 hypothetical protein SAMN06296036_1328 [Pseudobacteriovorax antillogorgiicola]